jgi:hypothetical protein
MGSVSQNQIQHSPKESVERQAASFRNLHSSVIYVTFLIIPLSSH